MGILLYTCQEPVIPLVMNGGQTGMAVDLMAGFVRGLPGQKVILLAGVPALAVPVDPALGTQGCK